ATPLFLGATADDQLGGDLGTRSERTNPDIAARELLRDHAHRLLTESKTAILLRDREPEHTQLRHLREDVERDVAVGAMPLLRLRCRRTCASRRGSLPASRPARSRRPCLRAGPASARSDGRGA